MTENDSSAGPAKKRNERTCAGCGKHAPADELVRVVHEPDSGEIAVDLAGSEFGRGGHVHPTPDCLAKALKGGFARVFKAKVVGDASALGLAIVSSADRRIEGLLAGARRAGQLSIGADVVVEALKNENAQLVLVASDAGKASAGLGEVQRAVAAGKAIAFGTKEHLGKLLKPRKPGDEGTEVALVAVLHPGVATAIQHTYRMSGPFRGLSSGVTDTSRSEAAWSSSSEVR